MPWFIKQETFTAAMTSLSAEQRRLHCHDHRRWVETQRLSGCAMASGFLVDDQHKPGGGGLLVFEADNYVIPHVLLSDLQGNRNPWYGRVLGLAWGSLIFSGMMNCVYYVQRVRAKLEKSVRAMGRVRKCWK